MAIMGKVHRTNDFGGGIKVPIKAPQQPGGETLYKEGYEKALAAEMTEYLKAEARKLPGASDDYKTINWFGGSYSGVDMKVVAHLYDEDKNIDKKIDALEKQANLAWAVRDACSTLIEGGFAQYVGFRDVTKSQVQLIKDFVAAAGLGNGEIEQEAGRIITESIYRKLSWSTIAGLAKGYIALERLRNKNQSMAESITEKLNSISAMKDKAQSTVVLASLQTLSVQSHREKYAVRALGTSYVKGYCRGPRTIAGSMIFTNFNEHALASLMRRMGSSKTYGEFDAALSTLIPDQLPPIDLTIVFANEYGSLSEFRLMGVEFINDGSTYSIEDLLSENIMTFVARDADILTSLGDAGLDKKASAVFNEYDGETSGSSLLFNNEHYYEYLDKIGVRRKLVNR